MSSTVAAWISGRTRATRRTGMPRMRSASMPLLGLVETRMSCSLRSSLFAAVVFDFGTALLSGTQRLDHADAECLGCGYGTETLAEEPAQTAVDGDARVAVGAIVDVDLDTLPLLIAEGTIEEEVENSFHIVTEHRCGFLPLDIGVTTRTGSELGCEFVNSLPGP